LDKVKVLVVDDSAFMRKLITNFLEEDSRFSVIGTARNGQDALKKLVHLKPDVITLDVEMPVLNGIDTLKEIMKFNPTPVVMLSSTTKAGAENTMLAFQYGAVDFITKPSGAISLDLHEVKEDITTKVYYASKILKERLKSYVYVQKIQSHHNAAKKNKANEDTYYKTLKYHKKLVCIGTSTGGPRALQKVLAHIPSDFNAPILIVQHMPPGFTKSLANRLNSLSSIEVKEAEDGEIIRNGVAYIAPGGLHMRIRKIGTAIAIQLVQTPLRNGHRPSVDVLFDSISEITTFSKVAIIMTGMGTDGTEGLQKMKLTGDVSSIAESEDTSIVFGMPKAAIASQSIDCILDLEDIPAEIIKLIQR
jgi:two-component system, chemotaxis family, protein-glutamate methylesterase/glutaminase